MPTAACAFSRAELPFERLTRLREVERVRDVRVRRDEVHRVVDDERLSLVSAQHAGRESPRGAKFFAFAGVICRSSL